MSALPTSRRRWLWLLVLGLAAFGGWRYWRSTEAGRPVLVTARFADGARVEILEAFVGTELSEGDFITPTAGASTPSAIRRWFSRWLPTKTPVSISSGSTGWNSSKIEYRWVNGEPRMRAVKFSTPQRSLLILLRGFEPDGQVSHWLESFRGTVQRTWQLDDPRRAGATNLRLSGSDAELSMRAEIWSGNLGQWQFIDGPLQMHVSDPRAFCWAVDFPRADPKLRLRFIRKGQPPVEVEIANSKPEQPKAWQAEPLPATKHASEGDVTLSCSKWMRDGFGLWGLWLEMRPKPVTEHIRLKLQSVEDASGNSFRGTGGSKQGADGMRGELIRMVPGNGPWRAVCELQRTETHPTPIGETVVFAEGEVVAVNEVELTPAPFARDLGAVRFKMQPSRRAARQDTMSFEFECTVSGAEATLTPFYQQYLESPQVKVFVDGQFMPGRSSNSGSGYGRGITFDLHFNAGWEGKLAPGTKFQLAIPKPRTPDTVEFTFDPPPLPSDINRPEK